MTTEEFIIRSIQKHGNKYDYSKVVYVNANTKVVIVCPTHGEFSQKPYSHISVGQGCPACGGTKRRTQEEFLTLLHEIHGDKYDTSKVKYVNNSTKVILTCQEHGDFYITPNSLIFGKAGCHFCANKANGLRSRHTKEEFIEKAKRVHGEKYDYSKVNYTTSHDIVTITCPEHGDFKQRAYGHLNGHGCPKCAINTIVEKERVKLEDFVARAKKCHEIEYDYSKVVMKGMHEPVCVICPKHGEFWQTPGNHLHGYGCTVCGYQLVSKLRSDTQEDFIAKAKQKHGDKYDYSESVYVGCNDKVAIRCRKHNMIFWQKASAHLYGYGCPTCAQSHLEKEVMDALLRKNIKFEPEKTFPWLKYTGNLYLDFYLPKYGIAIECQGSQHFNSSTFYGGMEALKVTKVRDAAKRKLCTQHGIKILYYSNLGIKYPYEVIENMEVLLQAIENQGNLENIPVPIQLEFEFD